MEKLLAIISIIQKANSNRLFANLLQNFLIIIGLTIILAIMGSALLIAGMIAAHVALISYGISWPSAIIIIAFSGIVVMMLLAFLIQSRLRTIRQQIPRSFSPLTSRAMDTFNAFTDGLMAR